MKKGLHLKFARALDKIALQAEAGDRFLVQLGHLRSFWGGKEGRLLAAQLAAMEVNDLRKMLGTVFAEVLDEVVINMLFLLIANRQMGLLPLIVTAYRRLYFERHGVSDIRIVTARELHGDDRDALRKQLGDNTGKKVHVAFSTDEKLIGGMQIYDNDILTDFSLKNQLVQLRHQLLNSSN